MFNDRVQLSTKGFALVLVPVSLWCDGVSMLRPAALVQSRRQGFRLQSGDVPSPHSGHAEVVWLVLVWQGRKVGLVL